MRLAQVVEDLQSAEAFRNQREWMSAWFGTPSTSGSAVSFIPEETGPTMLHGTLGSGGFAEEQDSCRVLVLTSASATALVAARADAEKFLAQLYALDSANVRKALMLTYRTLDAWLLEGRLESCDEVLRVLDTPRMSEAGTIGVLTVCAAARNRLSNYVNCASRVHRALASNHTEAEVGAILRGLE